MEDYNTDQVHEVNGKYVPICFGTWGTDNPVVQEAIRLLVEAEWDFAKGAPDQCGGVYWWRIARGAVYRKLSRYDERKFWACLKNEEDAEYARMQEICARLEQEREEYRAAVEARSAQSRAEREARQDELWRARKANRLAWQEMLRDTAAGEAKDAKRVLNPYEMND